LQPDSNGSNTASVPSVICPGAVRPVRRATYSRHRPGVCVPGSIGWPAASASRCVQVRSTTWTRSYPTAPVSSQRPPASRPRTRTIAPAESPSPPQFTKPQPNQRKPSRTQTTAAPLSRPIASFGLTWPAPAGGFGSRGGNRLGSTVGAVPCLTSPGVAAMGSCGTWQHRPLIRCE
jgi:hypothetical protein